MKASILYLATIGLFMSSLYSQDFRVSTNSAVGFWSQIAADSSGNFVLVWDDYRHDKIPYGGSGSDGDIYGQRFDKEGVPIGKNFRISDDSIDTDISYAGQTLPQISMNKKGEFVVTWIDTRPKGTKPDTPLEFNIYAQRFDKNWNPIGDNFLVNDIAEGGQVNPDVIVREDGSFVIIWIDTQNGIGGNLPSFRVYLQAFDTEGTRIGLNQKLPMYARQPRIGLFTNGNFIITGDTTGQIFSFPSTRAGDQFYISNGFTREVKINNDDRIFLAHMENRIVSDHLLDSDIFIQGYDTVGNPITNKIRVNDDLTYYWQISPSLSVDNNNVFLVWQDYRNGYQTGDGDCIDIYGQRFDLNLKTIGLNFKVSHEDNASLQISPTTILRNDMIYTAWFDGRKMEYYENVYPQIPKLDVWATVQNFDNPMEGVPIHCTPPPYQVPSAFSFIQSFPNPFQSLITFVYDLPEEANVSLTLFNLLGEEVKVLIEVYQIASRYTESFIIRDLPSGIYFARLVAKTASGNIYSSTVKVVLIK